MTHESDSWWEIPWISYFVSLFKHPFNITEFSILEFEDSLNNDDQGPTNNANQGSTVYRSDGAGYLTIPGTRLLAYQASQLFFTDLIIELLRGLYQNPKIDESSYEGKDIISRVHRVPYTGPKPFYL